MNKQGFFLGLALLAVGILWTLQGLGIVGGSPMSGQRIWSAIGPFVSLAGIMLIGRSRSRL